MNVETLRDAVKAKDSPIVIATEIGFVVSDGLEDGTLNLFEAFLLKDVEVSLLRLGYTKPAWSYNIGISHVLSIMMLYVTALYFDEEVLASKYVKWFEDALLNLKEKRKHYVFDLIPFVRSKDKSSLLSRLTSVRGSIREYENGPYHTEVFPYEYAEPEIWLQMGKIESDKKLSPEIIELITEIEMISS